MHLLIIGCAPSPGRYNPKSPGSKIIKGVTFDKAERFKEPSVPASHVISTFNILLFLFYF